MPDFDADFLKSLLMTAGALIWTAIGIKTLRKPHVAPTTIPNPLTVAMEEKLEDKFVSQTAHTALASQVQANQIKVEREIKELQAEGKTDREKLYNKLNAIGTEVASQRKADEFTQGMIARLEVKVDRLNERKADKS
ncbi:hypothetical protein ACWPKS_15890 [Coraliomargarita sp. W4R72]